MSRRPTLSQLRNLTAALKAERIARQPIVDRLEAAKAVGDRDAWFAAVNELRAATMIAGQPMEPMTRDEFDARNPR